jgi:Relaxase/Mobilisation nuclease domain
MIGKITKGSGFGGVFSYILDRDKKPVLLKEAQQCLSNTPQELAREFQYAANFRPTTKLPVRHFSIGFAKQDSESDKLTDDIKAEIAVRIMEKMGYGDCQYFAVAHGRYDPNHHEVHDHDHIHIVANAITVNGDRVTDYKDYYNLEQCLREIEEKYGLKPVENSWEKVKKIRAEPAPSELKDKIDKALTNSPNLREWIDRMETSGVNVRFRITSRGRVQGIGYVHDGGINKGGDVDRSWKLLSSRFEQTPENLELMRSANLRTQSLSVELKPEDQALLTKAADLAMQKLAGEDKFKDKSVQIIFVDDVLKVRRLRPNKIVLTAKKDSDGEWRSIGMPNIDAKKDLQILGDVGKVEIEVPNLDDKENLQVLKDMAKVEIEVVQVDRSSSKVSKQSLKSRGRSSELG